MASNDETDCRLKIPFCMLTRLLAGGKLKKYAHKSVDILVNVEL